MWSLEENANCARTYAAFRLVGDCLVGAEVTRRLGIEPEFVSEKGEHRADGKDLPAMPSTGVWSLSSSGRVESTSLERHVLFLLERLEPSADELREVVDDQSLRADVFCYWLSATGHGGPGFSPKTLERVSALDAVLSFDFYDGSDDAAVG